MYVVVVLVTPIKQKRALLVTFRGRARKREVNIQQQFMTEVPNATN